ncbi:MAG: hypothetical protein ACJ76I_11795 [Gaiellaceae bacterium]
MPTESDQQPLDQRELLELLRRRGLDELQVSTLVEYLAARTNHVRGDRELRFKVRNGRYQRGRVEAPLADDT